MMKTTLLWRWFAVALAMGTFYGPVHADRYITIRVSYKIILSPDDGQRPFQDRNQPGLGRITDQQVDDRIAEANAYLAGYGRGYRLQRLDPIYNIGGKGDTGGPSKYWNPNINNAEPAWGCHLNAAAQADPVGYLWNPAALNIYVVNGIHGGEYDCDAIHLGGESIAGANFGSEHLHEIMHLFGICHTQGCGINDGDGLDDEVADTILDGSTWGSEDVIAQHNFSHNYAQLSPSQKAQVDAVWYNLMSYHYAGGFLTEGQLDRFTDVANGGANDQVAGRAYLVTGNTRFVDHGADPSAASGSSAHPYASAFAGAVAANPQGGDIVLMRPGAYNEALYLVKPMVLRATLAGHVIIGSSRYATNVQPAPPTAAARTSTASGVVFDDSGAGAVRR
ncbi:MAG TPA: hypothetical protein VGM37_03240 [Armatimonadota bacterium]|jgi:hypothetical protein